jgi:hypothetical protein
MVSMGVETKNIEYLSRVQCNREMRDETLTCVLMVICIWECFGECDTDRHMRARCQTPMGRKCLFRRTVVEMH